MIRQLPSLFLGAWGVMIFWLAGNKSRKAWALGLLGQVWWASYALWLGEYGLLISAGLYGTVYVRNWLRWKPDALKEAPPC